MTVMRTIAGFLLATATTYILAVAFMTQQVIEKRAAIGAHYTQAQQFSTFTENLTGLAAAYGVVVMIALLLGFAVAAGVKRILKPLAPIAYPVGGAAAVFTAIYLIENTIAAGGVGALEGARGAVGIGLQCLAGFVGGVVFALISRRSA